MGKPSVILNRVETGSLCDAKGVRREGLLYLLVP